VGSTESSTEALTLGVSKDTGTSELGSEVISGAPATSAVTKNAVTEACLEYEKMFSEEEFLRGGSSLPNDNYESLFLEDDRKNFVKHNYDELFEEEIQVGGVNPPGTSSSLGQSGFSSGIYQGQSHGYTLPDTSGYVKLPDSQRDDLKDILGLNPLKGVDLRDPGKGVGYDPLRWGTESGYYEITNEDGGITIEIDGPDSLLDSYNGVSEFRTPFQPTITPPILDVFQTPFQPTITPPIFDVIVDVSGRVVENFPSWLDYVTSIYQETEEDKKARLELATNIATIKTQKKKNTETAYAAVSTYNAKSFEDKKTDMVSDRANARLKARDDAEANNKKDPEVIKNYEAKNDELQIKKNILEAKQEQSREEGKDLSVFEVPLKQINDEIEEGDFQIQQANQRITANTQIVSDYDQETEEQKKKRLAREAEDDPKKIETNDINNRISALKLGREKWDDWYESYYSGYRFFPSNFLFAQKQIGQAEFGPYVNEKYSWIRLEKQKYYEDVTSKFLPTLTTIKVDNNLSDITGFNLHTKEVLSDGRCFSGSALYLFKLNEQQSEEARRREAKDNLILYPNYRVDFVPTEQGNGHSEELDSWIKEKIIEPIEGKLEDANDTDLVNFVYVYNFINGTEKKNAWSNDVDEVFRTVDRNLIMAALNQIFLNEKIRDLLYKLEHFFDYEEGEAFFSFSNLFTDPESTDADYLALRGPGENLPKEKKFDVDTNKELLKLLKIEDKDVSKINFDNLNRKLVEICLEVKGTKEFLNYYQQYIEYIKSLNQVSEKGDPYIQTTASGRALDTLGKALKNWRNLFKVPSDETKRKVDSYPWTEPDVGPAQVLADQYKTNIVIRSESNYNKLNTVYNPRDKNNKFYEASTTINLLFMNMNGGSHYVALIDPTFHQEIGKTSPEEDLLEEKLEVIGTDGKPGVEGTVTSDKVDENDCNDEDFQESDLGKPFNIYFYNGGNPASDTDVHKNKKKLLETTRPTRPKGLVKFEDLDNTLKEQTQKSAQLTASSIKKAVSIMSKKTLNSESYLKGSLRNGLGKIICKKEEADETSYILVVVTAECDIEYDTKFQHFLEVYFSDDGGPNKSPLTDPSNWTRDIDVNADGTVMVNSIDNAISRLRELMPEHQNQKIEGFVRTSFSDQNICHLDEVNTAAPSSLFILLVVGTITTPTSETKSAEYPILEKYKILEVIGTDGKPGVNGMLQENTYDYVPGDPLIYTKTLVESIPVFPPSQNEVYFKLYNMSEEDIMRSKREEAVPEGFKSIEGPRKVIINNKDAIYNYGNSKYITTYVNNPVRNEKDFDTMYNKFLQDPEQFKRYKPITLDKVDCIYDDKNRRYVTKPLKMEMTPKVEEKSKPPPSDRLEVINVGGKIVKNGHKGKIDETDGLFVELDELGKMPIVVAKEEMISRDFVEVNPDKTTVKNGIVIKKGIMGKVDEGGVFRKIPHPVATGWSSYLYAPPVHHFMEVYPEGTSLKAERLINDELYLKLSNMSEKEIEESKTKETIAPGFKTVDGPRKANISGSDSIYDYNTSMYITKTHNPMSGGSIISLKQDYDNEFFETVPKPVVVIVALEKDYTDLFEMEPEPVMTDYTDLFEMEPEPAMTDYTDLFEMEPEPVMTDYTDLFETEPEPAMTDYTDLFETETEPAMTDYTDLFEVEPVRKDYTDLFEVEPVRTDYTYLFEMDFQ
jgi:hypothetical protein